MKKLSHLNDTAFQNTITLGSVSGNYNFDLLSDEVEKKLSHFKVNKFNTKIETNVTKKFSINEKWETKSAKNSIFSKSFIDLHNDVTTKDLKQAINEGYDRIEHLKDIQQIAWELTKEKLVALTL